MSRRIERVTQEIDDELPRKPPRRLERSKSQEGLRKWLERVEGRFMGSSVDVNPSDAILWAMRVTAGEVVYCDQQIARLEEDELFERRGMTRTIALPSGDVTEITEVQNTETMNRWVRWRQQALKNMAQYAKMAADMRIDEEQVRLAEHQAQTIVTMLTGILTELGHDLRDIRTREIVRRYLLEGSVVEGNGAQLVTQDQLQ